MIITRHRLVGSTPSKFHHRSKTKLYYWLFVLMLGQIVSTPTFAEEKRYEANWDSLDARPTPEW